MGLSVGEVAALVGISRPTVWKRLEMHGIHPRRLCIKGRPFSITRRQLERINYPKSKSRPTQVLLRQLRKEFHVQASPTFPQDTYAVPPPLVCADCGCERSRYSSRRCGACYQTLLVTRRECRAAQQKAKLAALESARFVLPAFLQPKLVIAQGVLQWHSPNEMKRCGDIAVWLPHSKRIEIALAQVTPRADSLFHSNVSKIQSLDAAVGDSGLKLVDQIGDRSALDPLATMLEAEQVQAIIQRLICERGLSFDAACALVESYL